MKTIKNVVENIQSYMNEFNWIEMDYDALYEIVEDEVLWSMILSLNDDEAKKIYSTKNDEGFVDSFLSSKYGEEYEILLTDIEQSLIAEMVADVENL